MFPMCHLHHPAHSRHLRLLRAGAGMMCAVLLGGCATTRPPDVAPPMPLSSVSVDPAPAPSPGFIPVIRYGRYTLVEMVPSPTQRDLMQQVIDVSVPGSYDANVGDALRYVLLRSGYRLCDTPDTHTLNALPLPAAHLHLGPLTLRDALLTLTGTDAWDLTVDTIHREVCFSRHRMPWMEVPPPTDTLPSPEALPLDVKTLPGMMRPSREVQP